MDENQIPVSLSVNDRGKIRFAIRDEELDHWTYALRVAYLGTLEKEPVILSAKRQVVARKRRLARLKGNFWVRLFARDAEMEVAELESEIRMLEAQVRDAESELAAFRSEVERLTKIYNPENLSYEEIQERYTPDAIANKLANNAAIGMWSARNGLPESAGRMFFKARALEPEQRQAFYRSVADKCLEVDAVNQMSAMRALEELPEAEREEAMRRLKNGNNGGNPNDG